MRHATEVMRHPVLRHPHSFHRCRGVAAAPHKAGYAVGDDGRDGSNIAIGQRGQRIVFRAANAGINDHHVCIPPRCDEARIAHVNACVVARGSRDGHFHGHIAQAGQMADGVHQPQWHDSRAGGRVGGNQKSIESLGLANKLAQPQRGAQVTGCAHLQRDVGLLDQPRVVRIGHGHRAAIGMKRHIGLHVQKVVCPDAR